MILKESTSNTESKKIKVSLWNNEGLSTAKLEPCVFQTTWDTIEGRLNAKTTEKSIDSQIGILRNSSNKDDLNNK